MQTIPAKRSQHRHMRALKPRTEGTAFAQVTDHRGWVSGLRFSSGDWFVSVRLERGKCGGFGWVKHNSARHTPTATPETGNRMSPKRVRLTLRSAWSVYCLGRKSCRAELLSSYLSVPDSAPAKPPNPCRHPERSSRSLRPGRSEGSLTVRGRRRAGGMWAASLSPPPPITFSDSSLRAAPPSPARRSVQNDSVFFG